MTLTTAYQEYSYSQGHHDTTHFAAVEGRNSISNVAKAGQNKVLSDNPGQCLVVFFLHIKISRTLKKM